MVLFSRGTSTTGHSSSDLNLTFNIVIFWSCSELIYSTHNETAEKEELAVTLYVCIYIVTHTTIARQRLRENHPEFMLSKI
jgi:hypothetical protein